MRVVGVIEENDRTRQCNEHTAGLVMGAPYLHIGGVGRVTGIDLIKVEQSRDTLFLHFLPKTPQAVPANYIEVNRRLAELHCAVLTGRTLPTSN